MELQVGFCITKLLWIDGGTEWWVVAFISIDESGVGKLVSNAVKDGLKTNKEIKLGICGEHGGDPKSIDFFHNIGLDYVSCSPYRVPIARLAAAQARIKK